jgi:hypothetical protein
VTSSTLILQVRLSDLHLLLHLAEEVDQVWPHPRRQPLLPLRRRHQLQPLRPLLRLPRQLVLPIVQRYRPSMMTS